MRKLFVVLSLNIVFFTSSFAQCNNFPYFILEISGSANEVYYSAVELNLSCSKMTDMEDPVEIQAELKIAVGIAKDVKNKLGFVDVAVENAQANAEICYCLNGQKAVYEMEEIYDECERLSDEILKLLKSAEKSKNPDQIMQFIDASLRLIPKLHESADKIVKLSAEGMDKCN
jgi:hypothetical protein